MVLSHWFANSTLLPKKRHDTRTQIMGNRITKGTLQQSTERKPSLSTHPLLQTVDKRFVTSIKYITINHRGSALMVTDFDEVYGIGSNKEYELGVGDNLPRLEAPARVVGLSGKKVKWIGLTKVNGAVVTEDGEVYMWGRNSFRLLLHQDENFVRSEPFKITGIPGKVVQLSFMSPALALTDRGEVYCWGFKVFRSDELDDAIEAPVKIGGVLSGKRIVQVAVGFDTSFALSEDGQLYSWGFNGVDGKMILGRRSNFDEYIPDIAEVTKGMKIVKIAVNLWHAMAISSDGKLVVWGDCEYLDTKIPLLNKHKAVDIGCGPWSCAVQTSKGIFVWGAVKMKQQFRKPKKLKYKSIDDMFLHAGW